MSDTPVSKTVQPHQLAWLHRPEFDKDHTQVWESPDGALHAHDKRQGPLVLEVLKRVKIK